MLKKSVLALALSGILTMPVYADLTINGFASIKAGITTGSNDQLYGYSDDLDFKNESLMALQIRSDLGEKLSVTAQLIGRGSNDFDIDFEWAFLTYQLSDNIQINAGRLRVPFYKYSEFMDVGYAYDWSRVPQSVYSLGFNNIEGVSLYHTTTLGNFDSSLQVMYGRYDGDTNLGPTQLNDVAGVSWELSRDWYSFRAAYFIAEVNASMRNPQIAGLFNALDANNLAGLRGELDFVAEDGSFLGFGVTIDKDNLIAVAEYNEVEVKESLFADRTNYFVSVGYRFGAVTPYVSYEIEDHKSQSSIYQPYAHLTTTALAPLYFGTVGVVESQRLDRQTINLGIRYDFHPSAAFKAQYSSQKDKLQNDRSGLMTVGVDLVF